ncbi:MAG: hypothetical protein WBB07_11235, partial [Mycobacterium sp.]
GVLGALAIAIAVLIVVNARDNNLNQQQTPPTVTDTVTPPPPGESGPPGEPDGTEPPPAEPSNWTPDEVTGHPGQTPGQTHYLAALWPDQAIVFSTEIDPPETIVR